MEIDSKDWEKDEYQCCSEGSKVKVKDPQKFSIRDGDQNVVVLDCGNLLAVPKKSYILSETFFALPSHLKSATAGKGDPILLAVSKGELCLCCDKDKGKSHPSLLLKKKKLMKLADEKEAVRKPFIFYNAKVGSLHTLESAAHRGWFICTSCNSGEPIGVTDKVGQKKHIEFLFEKVCKPEMSP
ncbi:Interleukin-37 [Fukomys damarensis]|uniref:Interleukin-1 n=1 Tax=Fukomys damarensis TaxID=885580 RepID=A0A091D8D8_FUKDA|nr:Interleukin-37 [Fukomys damarensis]